METIFDVPFDGEREISASGLQAWMSSIQSSQETGAVRLSLPPDERMVFHIHRGAWLPPLPNAVGLHPDDLKDEGAYNGRISAVFIPLTPHGLIHSNLLIQAQFRRLGKRFGAAEMSGSAHQLSGFGDEPYLIKLKWENAAGSILFNGVSNQPHSLYVSGGRMLDEPGISAPILERKDDPSCEIAVFSPDLNLDAWQELCLRKSFKRLCDMLLERFETLTGRIITESFSRILSAFAEARALELSVTKRQWNNHAVFASPFIAAETYRMALQELLDHYSAVIGPRLLASNLREVFSALPFGDRDTLNFYEILPEEYRL